MDNAGLLSSVHLLYLASHNLRLLIDEKIKEYDLGFNSWMVLVLIRNEPALLTQREIAARLGLKEPSVGELIKQLMKRKYLARAVDVHDRRKYAIKITAPGMAAYDAVQQALIPVLEDVFNDLDLSHLQRALTTILLTTKEYIAEGE